MLAAARHRKIVELLQESGSVKVSELSALFEVTEKTIREDLEKLEEKGLLKRIHGGAILEDRGEDSLLPIQIPNTRHRREKTAIAEYALQYVSPGDIIALDAGSTTLEMAKRMKNIPVTVLTNDLMIIRELAGKDQVRLVVPGGTRHHNLLIGNNAVEWVKRLNVHKLFLSATGIHPEYGLTIFTSELMELKKVFMSCAKEIFCLADHSKFNKGALLTFAALGDIHCFITDEGLDAQTANKYERLAVRIERAPMDIESH